MFGKKNQQEDTLYIIAVKDFSETQKAIESGTMSLPYDRSAYLDIVKNYKAMADNLQSLKKFFKLSNKPAKENKHYWEGLITQGYTLLQIAYNYERPSIEQICDTTKFKYVGNCLSKNSKESKNRGPRKALWYGDENSNTGS